MKIHRHLVEQVSIALIEIFYEGKYADKVVDKSLGQNRKWGARDRRFFAESVYECVRWWRKLWYVLDEEPSADKEKIMQVWMVWWLLNGGEIPSTWSEFSKLNVQQIFNRNKNLKSSSKEEDLVIKESIPDWFYQWGKRELGADLWPQVLSSMNEKAPVDLRVNTLLIQRSELIKKFNEEQILTNEVPDVPTALSLVDRKNVFITDAYKKGFFEVQDRASQMVAEFLNPLPKERVIDACAGAGGKSLHLAALMKNKGKIISMDITEWKLNELRKRASRARVDIIETKLIDSNKVIKRLADSADRLLLDVPCSGSGVIRRNTDSKWKLSESEVQKIIQIQEEILTEYSVMVKKGGYMAYATCSIMPSENMSQVEKFLQKEGQNWALLKHKTILPHLGKGDGFFVALLQRKVT